MTTLGLLYLQVNKWYCTVYMEKLDTVIIKLLLLLLFPLNYTVLVLALQDKKIILFFSLFTCIFQLGQTSKAFEHLGNALTYDPSNVKVQL